MFNRNYQQKFDEKLKEKVFNNVYHYEKWMIGKNSMKLDYLKKKIFTVT